MDDGAMTSDRVRPMCSGRLKTLAVQNDLEAWNEH